jgi:hypothetical protein
MLYLDPTTISTKRRLSLSYLLDQSDKDHTCASSTTTCLSDQYKLAPISIVSNTNSAYCHSKMTIVYLLYYHF